MANEHDFNVTLIEGREFDLTIGTESDPNSHSFSSTINQWNLFNIIIDGMTTSASWLLNIIQGIAIDAQILCTIGLESTVVLQGIIIDAVIQITANFTSEVRLVRIIIGGFFQQTKNFPITIALKRILITPAILIMRNSVIDIIVPKIAIVASATLGYFRRLWFYDSMELWEMDGITLGDLDYSES